MLFVLFDGGMKGRWSNDKACGGECLAEEEKGREGGLGTQGEGLGLLCNFRLLRRLGCVGVGVLFLLRLYSTLPTLLYSMYGTLLHHR